MNGWRESDWPNCPTKPVGLEMNSYPSNCPRKNSILIGPSHPRILGSLTGSTRFTRNMLIGTALSLNIIGPPSPGPHQSLCLPKETSQFDVVRPTYASRKRNWLTSGVTVSGGKSWRSFPFQTVYPPVI